MERVCKKCGKVGEDGPRDDSRTTFDPRQGNVCRACKRVYDTARRLRMQAEGGAAHERHKEAMRMSSAVRKFGITHAEAREYYAEEACRICGGGNGVRRLNIDHCHATGKIRGVLCNRCNRGVGFFLDDPALLRRAADYLESHLMATAGEKP